MKIIWFQAFLAVVRCRRFSDAAEEMYTSQANVSKYISLLEKELGVTLFDRSTRTAQLTDDGKAILPYAEKIVETFSALQDAISLNKSEESASISIASVPIIHLYNLPGILVEFNRAHPCIHLEMMETDMNGVLQCLEKEKNAIGILRTCALQMLPETEKWHKSPFIYDELVLLCNRKNPLAGAGEISLSDCLDEKLIILSTGFDEYRLLLMDYGIPANRFAPKIKCASVSTLKNYVENDLGVSLITRGMAKKICDNKTLIIRRLAEKPRFPLSIVTRKNAFTPEASILIQQMIDACRDIDEETNADGPI